jgi:hypothetical protein
MPIRQQLHVPKRQLSAAPTGKLNGCNEGALLTGSTGTFLAALAERVA